MTVVSKNGKNIRKIGKSARCQKEDRCFFRFVNIFLLFSVLVMFVGYVILSNHAVAQEYAAFASKAKVNQFKLGETSDSYDTKELMSFAKKSGMVETTSFGALYDKSGLAYDN